LLELTRDKGILLKSSLPVARHQDGFTFPRFVCCLIALRLGVFDDAAHVFRSQGVEHVKRIRAMGLTTLWHGVREVLHQLFVLPDLREDVSDTELVVLGHAHMPDIRKLQ
jgi:hypothetical protein